jgi:N-hydroxyarylamine O-acetyltransferase
VTEDLWQIDRFDLDGYLDRIGVAHESPSRDLLDRVHEAHLRTFTFDNIDVLLEQHPGVSLAAVEEKFVGRGRGGYCFEHSTVLAAALQRLGFEARRQLGRVGDPMRSGRTHLVVIVRLDGEELLCDPGFGLSIVRPHPLRDGAEDDHRGQRFRVDKVEGGWTLSRWHEDRWELQHLTDGLPVIPDDVVIGHHYTSTFPASHFRSGLKITKQLADRHVSVTHETVTVRRPGQPTEHRELADGELVEWLRALDVPLTEDEESRLFAKLRP